MLEEYSNYGGVFGALSRNRRVVAATSVPCCLMQEYGSSYSCAMLPYAGIWE